MVVGLFPIWVRSSEPFDSSDERAILDMTPLEVADYASGRVEALGAWRLESPNRFFGSYSALVSLGDGTLLAASDSGWRLRFTPPGNTGPGPLLPGGVKRSREPLSEAASKVPSPSETSAE